MKASAVADRSRACAHCATCRQASATASRVAPPPSTAGVSARCRLERWGWGTLYSLGGGRPRAGFSHRVQPTEQPATTNWPDLRSWESQYTATEIVDAIASIGLEGVEVETVGIDGSGNYVVRFQDLGRKIRDGFEAALGEGFDPVGGLERLETVGPRVGEQLRTSGIFSVLVALLMILIYIAFRFDVRYAPGAVLALAHDVAITVGVFTVIQMEISLPIIAALLTIVGYSLNDTIVIFDRIRESLAEQGDSDVVGTVNQSINRTLSRTTMTSLTTLLAVCAIYFFGGGLIKDFAFSLIIGIVVGTYSSIFIASPVMVFMDRYIRTRKASQRVMQA